MTHFVGIATQIPPTGDNFFSIPRHHRKCLGAIWGGFACRFKSCLKKKKVQIFHRWWSFGFFGQKAP